MAEEISIDTIMSQAQVFASAWALVGGHIRRRPRHRER